MTSARRTAGLTATALALLASGAAPAFGAPVGPMQFGPDGRWIPGTDWSPLQCSGGCAGDPVLLEDSGTVRYGQSITLNVLTNDDPGDYGPLSLKSAEVQYVYNVQGGEGDVLSQINPGTVAVVDGKLVYTAADEAPAFVEHYDVLVSYTAADAYDRTLSTSVYIRVITNSFVPVENVEARNDEASTFTAEEVTVPVLENDDYSFDPGGGMFPTSVEDLTVTSTWGAKNGEARISPDGKEVLYTPYPGFVGTDKFTYVAQSAQGAQGTAHVFITVEGKLAMARNDTLVLQRNASGTVNVLVNDASSDGSALEIIGATNGQYGSVRIVDNQLEYTPNADFTGNDSFTYEAVDGVGQVVNATVNVVVEPAAAPGPEAEDDLLTVDQDTPGTVNVIQNDASFDGSDLTVVSTGNGQNGTTRIVNNQVEYTPNTGFNGTDSFEYTIEDGSGNSTTGTVNVTIIPAAPTAEDDSLTVEQDTPGTVNVIENDSSADGSPLTVITVENGTNGTTRIVDNEVVYTPNTGFNGTDSFEYTIEDGNGKITTGTVNVVILPADPTAEDDSLTVEQDTPGTVDVIENDSSADNSPLTVVETGPGTNGTTRIVDNKVVYTPNTGFNGTDSFEYTIEDGNGNVTTGTVNVIVLPADPTAEDDTLTVDQNTPGTVDVIENDSSADDSPLTVVDVENGTNGTTRIVNNEVVYTPNRDFNGTDSFEYTIEDGNGNITTGTVRVTIVPAAPTAEDDTLTVDQDTPGTVDVVVNDSSADGSDLTVVTVENGTNGTTKIVDNKVVYTPNTGFNGTDSFEYTIEDGNGKTTTGTVNVIIVPAAPKAADDALTVKQDTPGTVDVIENDSSADGSDLTVVTVENGTNGTTKIVNNEVVYTPNTGYTGADSFEYTIEDGNGKTTTGTVNVTITPNDVVVTPPVVTPPVVTPPVVTPPVVAPPVVTPPVSTPVVVTPPVVVNKPVVPTAPRANPAPVSTPTLLPQETVEVTSLAKTGEDIAGGVLLGTFLVAGGFTITVAARRRRQEG